MHEMSLAESVLQIVEEAARGQKEAGFVRIRAVFVEIGQLSSVEPEALRFCFEAVACGTLAEGARLEVIEVPGEGCCSHCQQTVRLAARYEPCPACGGYPVQATGGTEMRVKEIEVE